MVPSINHMPIYNCSEFTNQYQNHDYYTMAEMVCGRNVLWPNRSVDETSRKQLNREKFQDEMTILNILVSVEFMLLLGSFFFDLFLNKVYEINLQSFNRCPNNIFLSSKDILMDADILFINLYKDVSKNVFLQFSFKTYYS